MSETPKPPLSDRLRYLFTGSTASAVAPLGQPQTVNALDGLSRGELARKLLSAMLSEPAPDMPLIRDIVLRDKEILKTSYNNTSISVGGQAPQMPWLCYAATVADNGGLLRLLIENAAPLDARDTLHQGTPLYWAAMSGNKAAAEILLAQAGGIEDRNNRLGKTPAETAAHFGHNELAAWFKSREPMVPRIPDRIRPPKSRVVFKS